MDGMYEAYLISYAVFPGDASLACNRVGRSRDFKANSLKTKLN